MKRRTFLAAGTGSVLVACSPGATVEPSLSVSAKSLAGRTIEELGAVTLTVWDQENRAGQNEAIESLNAQFQTQYPNLTVRRLSQSRDDLRKQAAKALTGDDVPDVLQVNDTRAEMGQFIRDGLLLSLAAYSDVFSWGERFPAAVVQRMRYSPDAVTFGEGDLYGLPQTGSIVGIYYRQETLRALGDDPPETWQAFFDLLAAARGGGKRPLVLGNLEKWPALDVFGPLQAAFVPASEAATLALGNKGASWLSDGNLQALSTLASWSADGYFGDSPNGTDYEAAWRAFSEDKAAFFIAGSWLATDLEDAMGASLRFMAPPPGVDGGLATTGGTGLPWAIPARAEHPEVAAAYLDFITSPAAMETIAANGAMPVLRTAELAPEAGVSKDVYEAFTAVSERGTLLPTLDYATPTFGDTAGTALQELIGGQKDPQAVAEMLEADYAAFVA